MTMKTVMKRKTWNNSVTRAIITCSLHCWKLIQKYMRSNIWPAYFVTWLFGFSFCQNLSLITKTFQSGHKMFQYRTFSSSSLSKTGNLAFLILTPRTGINSWTNWADKFIKYSKLPFTTIHFTFVFELICFR